MKKIKLTKLDFAQLSMGNEELSKLKGGYENNNNIIVGCGCPPSPNNSDIIINTNTHEGCHCSCE